VGSVPAALRLASIAGPVLAAVGLLALVPAVAAAVTRSAGPFAYVTQTDASDSPSVAIEADCPGTSRVAGGGGSIAPGPPAEAALTSTYPLDTDVDLDRDDAYQAQAKNLTGASRERSATAICLKRGQASLDYRELSQTVGTEPFEVGSGVPCGLSTRVLGGGVFLQPPTPQVSLLESHPDADGGGWRYLAFKDETMASRDFVAHAICIPHAQRRVRYVFDSKVVFADQQKTVRAVCPSKFHVSGGGVEGAASYASSVPFDGNDRDKAPDDGWSGTIQTFNRTVAFVVRAICVK
jgi:hypothetical protein